jgi:hypothetical protein
MAKVKSKETLPKNDFRWCCGPRLRGGYDKIVLHILIDKEM